MSTSCWQIQTGLLFHVVSQPFRDLSSTFTISLHALCVDGEQLMCWAFRYMLWFILAVHPHPRRVIPFVCADILPWPLWPIAVWFQILHNAFCRIGAYPGHVANNKYLSHHSGTRYCEKGNHTRMKEPNEFDSSDAKSLSYSKHLCKEILHFGNREEFLIIHHTKIVNK